MDKDLGIPKAFNDAPMSLSHDDVKQWFIDHGAKGVVKKQVIANILRLSVRTIKNAEKSKQLKSLTHGVYDLNDVVDWAIKKNPKVLAQEACYEITEELYNRVKITLLNKHKTLISVYPDTLEDLVSEICLEISKQKKSLTVDENFVINSTIINVWEKVKKNKNQTISIETLKKESL